MATCDRLWFCALLLPLNMGIECPPLGGVLGGRQARPVGDRVGGFSDFGMQVSAAVDYPGALPRADKARSDLFTATQTPCGSNSAYLWLLRSASSGRGLGFTTL